MQSLRPTLFVLLLIASTSSYSQEFLRYQINWGDDSIGMIEARREIKDNGETHYVINSSSSFRVVFKFHLTFDYFCSYKGDSLIKASAIRKMNGNEKERSWTTFEEDKYRIFVDGKELDTPDQDIGYSISMMYFTEPAPGCQRVFSERFGENIPVEKEGTKSYKLSLPNGYSNVYNYGEDGICQSVDVETRWADLRFHLVD